MQVKLGRSRPVDSPEGLGHLSGQMQETVMDYLAIAFLGLKFSGTTAAIIFAVVVVIIVAGWYLMTRRR
jgi:hypothetical protein